MIVDSIDPFFCSHGVPQPHSCHAVNFREGSRNHDELVLGLVDEDERGRRHRPDERSYFIAGHNRAGWIVGAAHVHHARLRCARRCDFAQIVLVIRSERYLDRLGM